MNSRARVERAKEIDLIRLVEGEGHAFKRGPRYIMICCVFHNERTPSLAIYEDGFHCYGCGEHGDAITWIMKTRQVEFVDAVRYLNKIV